MTAKFNMNYSTRLDETTGDYSPYLAIDYFQFNEDPNEVIVTIKEGSQD